MSNHSDHQSHPNSTSGLSAESHRALIDSVRAQAQRLRERSRSGLPALDHHGADWIPGYHLVREIHRGGQGVVYQAVQLATQRHVAVKVLRDGALATPTEQVRFDREIQILAQLDHPSIVTIHDSGIASAAGRRYFVMDYIRGQPLDAYIAGAAPPLPALLDLLARICEGVHAAHLRGIIHRDLKPSNIRVDESGSPHLLDFGLAKAAWAQPDSATTQSAHTMTGEFVGSMPWAAPEQAEGATTQIDVRTDVYALGVVIYQSLTARFPYDITGSAREVLQRIVSAEPLLPSSISAAPYPLDHELDTIILKCLAKERERRYQSAGDLALDLRRYLAGEPIDAKRDSVTYILRKQLRRQRGPVAAAAAFLLLLCSALIVSLVLWRHSERHLKEAEAARADAIAKAAEAEREADRVRKVRDLIISIFKSHDPLDGGDRSLSALEVVNRGADRAMSRMGDEPMLQSSMFEAVGVIYHHLGDLPRARELLGRALALRQQVLSPGNEDIAETANYLALADEAAGDLEAAAIHYRVSYDVMRRSLGPGDWHITSSLARILKARGDAAGAETIIREELDRMHHADPPASPMALVPMLNLYGGILDDMNRPADAVGAMREAAALCKDLPFHMTDLTWAVENNLAWVLIHTHELDEAQQLAEKVLTLRRANLPADHLDTASSLMVLGTAKLQAGDKQAAEPLLRESLRIREKSLKPDDDRILQTRSMLQECLGSPSQSEGAGGRVQSPP